MALGSPNLSGLLAVRLVENAPVMSHNWPEAFHPGGTHHP
jgi:hypothetical protein